jgi:hypothetical protein
MRSIQPALVKYEGVLGAHIIITKGFFPQFPDIKNLAKISKNLAKLIECTIEKQKK